MVKSPQNSRRPANPPPTSSPLSQYPSRPPRTNTTKRVVNDRIPTEDFTIPVYVAQEVPYSICSQSHTFRIESDGTLKIVKDRRPYYAIKGDIEIVELPDDAW
ncbi:hypothetical protein O181_064488 [Austropuccinia psidii MF-1]|uniref:Uncharacterized protein n=1 Tax=Austropuccinia psidii MF-1 TaxID=1389203 RepID=A0A9Q3ETL2_9BASI|nr:hypothetical protein [Austropuccinia psidii MF-1]